MKEFIELREAELKADLEKVAQQVADLQATAQRIQGVARQHRDLVNPNGERDQRC